MPDPVIIAAIFGVAGNVVSKLLEHYLGRSPEENAGKAINKHYKDLQPRVSPNSLRVLKVLYDAQSALSFSQVQADAEEKRQEQEPRGDPIEADVEFRLKYLGAFGLVSPAGSDFQLSQLGAAFIERARTDANAYRLVFR